MYWIVSEDNWRSSTLNLFIHDSLYYVGDMNDNETRSVYSHNLMQLFLLFSTLLPEDSFPAL